MNDDPDLPDALGGDTPESSQVSADARPGCAGWIYLVVLLAPMVLGCLALLEGSKDGIGLGLTAFFLGSPIAGIATGCGFASGLRKLSPGQRIAAGFGMSLVFTAASAALAWGGCTAFFAL